MNKERDSQIPRDYIAELSPIQTEVNVGWHKLIECVNQGGTKPKQSLWGKIKTKLLRIFK